MVSIVDLKYASSIIFLLLVACKDVTPFLTPTLVTRSLKNSNHATFLVSSTRSTSSLINFGVTKRRPLSLCATKKSKGSSDGTTSARTARSSGGGGGTTTTTTPGGSKKVQVKMLKYVEGTGHVGEIILVTPAFFQNKLKPTRSAILITDEEVEQEKVQGIQQQQHRDAIANEMKEICDEIILYVPRKCGSDGHLFGSIGPKIIMDELCHHEQIQSFGNEHTDLMKQKGTKLLSIVDMKEGETIKGDIKFTGEYSVSIAFTKTIVANVKVHVQSELKP